MSRLALVVVAFLMGVVAWAQEPSPRYGGELVVAIAADPPGWDPSASTSQEIARVVYHNVFEGLVRFDERGEIVPALAESWRWSDDRMALSFRLREGVRFHDGSPLTLEDVVAKFERARDPDSGHTNSAYYQVIDAIRTDPDANEVTFVLSRPSRSLLYDLARPDSIIYPAGSAERQRRAPIGTGPFRFASYREGSEVRLERFDAYYLPGVPYLDAVTFRILGDPNTRFAALLAGDVDLIGTSLTPEQFLQIQDRPGFVATEGTATTEITLGMNQERPPFDDIRVRRAVQHAIDKRAIVDGAMFGLGTVIGTHMSPSESYYLDLSGRYPHDPSLARDLLRAAGYEDRGPRVVFELPAPYAIERRAGQVVAQQLEAVGFEVELQVVEWATWLRRIFRDGDYQLTIIGHSEPRDIAIYGDPDYYFGYDEPAVRALLAEAEAAPDGETERDAYRRVARRIAEDAVAAWLFSPPYLVAARDGVHGFWTDQPTPAIDVTGVYLDR
jgi:peptide/nickel transport system substrate-binding protein